MLRPNVVCLPQSSHLVAIAELPYPSFVGWVNQLRPVWPETGPQVAQTLRLPARHHDSQVGAEPSGMSRCSKPMSLEAGHPHKTFTVRQAAFIGVGSMVGAGIFSLLGAAGEVAGAAVWVSFLIAGGIAMLQGYSFAKFGATYPSAGGLLEYVSRGFGVGHTASITAWLVYSANIIVTAMVAVSFGSYASSMFADESAVWAKIFAVLVVIAMTVLNVVGSTAVVRIQSVIVFVVVGILGFFAIVTIANMDPSLLAPSHYPGVQDIVSSVALTFFAFL